MEFFIFLQYPGAFFSKINSYLYIIKTFRQHFIINLQTISGPLLSGQHRHQGPVSKKTALRGFPARQRVTGNRHKATWAGLRRAVPQ